MTPRRLPSLHLQLIGCTDRSAVKWRAWSTTHSCSALAGAYIRSSGDNALSVESMVGWPYQVAVSSPLTYEPLGLSLALTPILCIRELNLLFWRWQTNLTCWMTTFLENHAHRSHYRYCNLVHCCSTASMPSWRCVSGHQTTFSD